MAVFEFKALDKKTGKESKGVMEGESPKQVRAALKDKGLMVLDLKKANESSSESTLKGAKSASKRLTASTTDLSLITRQLSTLVGSGLPLEEALKALSQQIEKPALRTAIASVREKLVEGFSLSESLALYPRIFDRLYQQMVAAGEKSGHLDNVLENLAEYTENKERVRSTLMMAMLYPIILAVVAISVVAFLLSSVVPKILEQFADTGQDLPTPTRILMVLSDFVLNYGLVLLLIVIGIVFLYKILMRNEKNRKLVDKWILGVPVLGKVILSVNTARYASTLSIMISSAVPLLDAMKVATDVLDNLYIRDKLAEATASVREGSDLNVALRATKLFSPMMLYMVASGEKSGELETMLSRSAKAQEDAFEAQVKVALGVFTPLMILIMAGMVLFIVLAMLLPMMAMNNSV